MEIIESARTPTVAQNFNLLCNVSGTGKLNPIITYQWIKTDESQTQVGTNSNNLTFSPLRVSNASNYTCKVTVSSSYLTGDIAAMNSQDIRIQSKYSILECVLCKDGRITDDAYLDTTIIFTQSQ